MRQEDAHPDLVLNSRQITRTRERSDRNVEERLTIGLGPEKGNLLRLAAYLGIDFIWKEHLSTQDLVSELAEADVFLLLSKSEAYGIAVAEALSVGTPCRAAKTTALRESIEEPSCFGVEKAPDPQRVARLTLYILENELEAGPFSEKIKMCAHVVQVYEALYQTC